MAGLDPGTPDPVERGMELFALHQRRIFLYISALVPSPADAEEIAHETNIVIWKKFDQFQPGGDFLSWAYKIAYYQILEQRRRKARAPAGFSPEVLEQLAQTARDEDENLERRRTALVGCTRKLPASDQALLEECYGAGARVESVAGRKGRAPTSVYRSLRRIRQWLTECVERTLAAEGGL
jgi:RNA polymerase sigma-70 factor (ECF subfamily)